MVRIALLAVLLVAGSSVLAGCGKKGDLEPPLGIEETKKNKKE